jgi:hypothetical protein
MRRSFRLALAASLLAAPAFAQDRPPAFPTRDAAVTYRIAGGGEMRMAWLAAEQRMRMDMPGQGMAMLLDLRGRKAFMVMDAQRMVMEVPVGQEHMAQAGQIPADARLTREGTDRVAGQACTLWRMEHRGQSAVSCVTAEGIPLRVRDGKGETAMEATQVAIGPQESARFRPPAGYQSMQMPQGMPPQGAPRR